jgi:pyrroloquinoline quinone (PQQ) biosynthesis protein C
MLKQILNESIHKMVEKTKQIDNLNPEVYKWWLAQTYFYTSHSEKLLRYFSENSSNELIAKRWLAHADEEAGHENMAIGDLKRMGGKIEDYIELPETSALYKTQYFIAKETHGIANFGWALALEGLAAHMCKDMIDQMVEAHGENCMKFILVHVNEDPAHLDAALEVVSQIGATDQIIQNIQNTAYYYCKMLDELEEFALKDSLIAA